MVLSDFRKPLNPNLDAVKPAVKGIGVDYKREKHTMTDHEIDKLFGELFHKPGPASYDVNYDKTERRADVGVINMKKTVPIIEKEDEVDYKLPLYPNADAILPNHMSFKYYEPSKDIGPMNIPDKALNPGVWRFYDVDLDTVKE